MSLVLVGTANRAFGQPTENLPRHLRLVVVPGDRLGELLADAGLGLAQAETIVEALSQAFPPRLLRPGHVIDLFVQGQSNPILTSLIFQPQPDLELRLALQPDGGLALESRKIPLANTLTVERGVIRSSLFQAMTSAGTPGHVVMSLVQVLASVVDLQRDLQPGDRVTILRERLRSASGAIVREGQALLVELVQPDERHLFFRFAPQGRDPEWYDVKGQSLRRAFLQTPIEAVRITSSFGLRRHPVLGYSRIHRGVDFGAPQGTPVYAAGDGVVTFSGRRGDYGNLVELDHGGPHVTRYAHLARISQSARRGARVRQGDVIGTVGSTGLSTGPHLHFELLRNGEHVDPASLRSLGGSRLAGRDLANFRQALGVAEARLRLPPPA